MTGRVLDVPDASGRGTCDVHRGEEEVVDLSGLTVLPGFVDAHVHRELPRSGLFTVEGI